MIIIINNYYFISYNLLLYFFNLYVYDNAQSKQNHSYDLKKRISHMHTFYRPFTILIFLIIFFPLTVQLLHGMELKTPESYKEFLINNAEDLEKQYINAQKVTWHKNSQAYTFIHQEERDKLLFKLVFYCMSDQKIYTAYYRYDKTNDKKKDKKDYPIYPFPHDNVLPQFNDNNEAYFHADGYIKIPNNKNFYRALILYTLSTNPNSKPKEIRCSIGVPPSPDDKYSHIDFPPSHNCTYLLPFKSLLTALLNSSEPRIVYTNYKEEDQVMVYFIYKTYIPDDYQFCTLCNHIQPYSYRGIKYFEDLPDKLRMPIIKQYQNQLKKKTIEQNSSYNKPRILQRDPQPTNINDVLKNDALLINELTRHSTKKNKHSKKLYQAEETLLQAFESNIFKHYSPKTRENALTIRNNVIARDDMIQLIHNNNIKDFLIWTRYNPTALNIHSPVLNDGTLVHFIVHHTAPNDCNAFLDVALQHKPNLNRLDKYGRTPLFYAIINKNVAIAQQLIKNGASTRLKDHTKNTLMHYAVCQNIQDNNLNKQKEIINFCLKNTQELNAKNNFGNTPVHLALLGNIHQELLEILFSNVSLNFSLKNKKGETLQSILKEKPACQNRERITQLIDATLEQKRKCSCTEKFKQIKT